MSRSSPVPASSRALAACVVAIVSSLGGCSCAPECRPGFTDTCYPGPEGTAGIGLCRSGIQQCLNNRLTDVCQGAILPAEEACDGADNDCDGETDEDVRNACGGCSLLEGVPGETCAPCAKWECRGVDLVACPPPALTIGAECENDSGCPGTVRCGADGSLRCAGPRANECGVCGGSAVDGLGSFCTDGECPGVFVCDGLGQSAVCQTAPRNNCGVCNAPDVEFLGNTCAPAVPGDCLGTYECDEEGTAAVCVSPAKNACGLCDGPDLPELGEECEISGCLGTRVCAGGGIATVCRPNPGCIVSADHVVISEVAGGGLSSSGSADADNEFIELYNPTASAVPLAGWSLWYLGTNSTTFQSSATSWFTFPAGATIAPRGYVLVGRGPASSPGYRWNASETTRAPDFFTTSSAPNMAGATGSGGRVYLMRTNVRPGASNVAPRLDTNLVDLVGWGNAGAEREGSGAAPQAPAAAGSIERKALESSTAESMSVGGSDEFLGNGHDSNDNSRDWVARPVRDPQNALAAAEPEGAIDPPDAGSDTPDAGTDTPDAGEETPDAGTETPDAGEEAPDAGPVE